MIINGILDFVPAAARLRMRLEEQSGTSSESDEERWVLSHHHTARRLGEIR